MLHSTAQVEAMLKATGGVSVQYDGVSTWGHFENVPAAVGELGSGVVASDPSVVIASESLPGICLDNGAGSVGGVNEELLVGDYYWTVRGIEPGEAVGEIRLLLSNRRASGA